MRAGRLLIVAAALLAATVANAETQVKIGVMNDRSGLYADMSGEGSVVAAKLAIEDFKAADKGLKVEVVSADHQNKADVAINTAREWFDQQGVDIIVDVPNSGVALALSELIKEKNKVFINSAPRLRISPARNALRTRSTGPMTHGRSPMGLEAPL
jgi:branched-chain amino acid transport system substrate-binding protein